MESKNVEAYARRLEDLGRRQTELERTGINLIASDNAFEQCTAERGREQTR